MNVENPSMTKDAFEAEAVFHLNELFFSRTDERGVIQAGNTVFHRVSGYEWSELIGAPHKLVRHPDMPKGVFEVMWQRIQAGKPTGAYVKNRRKCGRYYWVFALVSPGDQGYVSTRLKPTSALHGQVVAMYDALLAREKDEGLTPQESGAALLEMLRGAGFADYDIFQSSALAQESQARRIGMGQQVDQVQRRFLDMAKAIAQVESETSEMTEAFKAIRTVPMNMRLIASRLENAGGPISAISVNYSQMLEEMSTWVTTFVDGEACVFARIREAIYLGQFLGFSSALEREMIQFFEEHQDGHPDDVDAAQERAHLLAHQERFFKMMETTLTQIEGEARRFARSVLDMKRYVTGLSSTRMMCKIESAALSNSGTALAGIVEQLDECQNEIEERLARIVELNAVVQANTVMLRSLI